MAKRLTQALGVDIGTQSIKVAAVRLGKDGAVISGLARGVTPDNAIDHTGIFDPTALGGALKNVLAEGGLMGIKDVIFSISGQSAVVVRNLEVPRMSGNELDDHMKWEIQRNIPFAESTVVHDYRAVDNPALAASQNMEVVMAVSPQSAIDMVLELGKAAGTRIAAIDVEPMALGRVLRTCHPNDLGAKNCCVVDVGHLSTAINMYRDGWLAFPRTVPIGGMQFSKAISDAFGITMEEAEARKKSAQIPDASGLTQAMPTVQPYMPSGEEGDVPAPDVYAPVPTPGADLFSAIESQLGEFVAEVRRSIDYFRSRGGEVEVIGVSGGGANLVGLTSFIDRSLGIPAMVIDPFNGVGAELSPAAETLKAELASEFAVAIGMGLWIAYD
jgi:type IV pilus assembly protein PilM